MGTMTGNRNDDNKSGEGGDANSVSDTVAINNRSDDSGAGTSTGAVTNRRAESDGTSPTTQTRRDDGVQEEESPPQHPGIPSDLSVSSVGLRKSRRNTSQRLPPLGLSTSHRKTSRRGTPPLPKVITPTNPRDAYLLETTHLVLDDLVQPSDFFDENPARTLATFETNEVRVGPVLGTGEYGIVYEVERFQLLTSGDTVLSDQGSAANPPQPPPQPPRIPMPSPLVPPRSIVLVNDPVGSELLMAPQDVLQQQQEDGQGHHRRRTSAVTFVDERLDEPDMLPYDNNNLQEPHQKKELRRIHSVVSACTMPSLLGGDDTISGVDSDDALSLLDGCGCGDGDLWNYDPQQEVKATRRNMAQRHHRNGEARYALKRIKESLIHAADAETKNKKGDAKSFDKENTALMDAVVDLACEAKYLASISHSNIIRLRGTVGVPGTPGFCLLMDRLVRTLDQQIEKEWKIQQQKYKGKLLGVLGRDSKGQQQLYADRLLATFDIARAMRHLHYKGIIYRDLKPDNIGFDVRGDVRLFDFGLAKELKAKDLVEKPDKFDVTGLTGSRRYMSPECVRCLPYGFSSDVYSFSILLWQIFALQTPFPDYDANKHFEKVVAKGKRPPIRAVTNLPSSTSFVKLMESGWSEDPSKRPTFNEICDTLQSEVNETDGGETNVSDRTTFLMDQSLASFDKYNEEENIAT